MTALRFTIQHFWLFVAAIFCDVFGRCLSTATTCAADESCQQRSASLVQKRTVKTRVEPEAAPLGAPVAATASTSVNSSDASNDGLTVGLPVAAQMSAIMSAAMLTNETADAIMSHADSLVKASMPVIQERTMVGEEAAPRESSEEASPRESSRSFSEILAKGVKDLDEYMRGKPQVLNIFVMMLLPAGICAVMCCICNIIHVMEDGADGQRPRDDKAGEGPDVVESRQTLGESMHPSASQKASYEPLCAELLAPGSTTECLIALPSINEVGQDGGSTFERTIVSKTGQPIVTVRVAITRAADGMPDVAGGGSYGTPGQMLERISLIAFKKQNALGFCELRVPNGGVSAARPLKCCIYRPTGDLFATLEEESTGVVSSLLAASGSSSINPACGSSYDGRCYMLTTVATGTRVWIQGDIKERSLVVVSESNEQKPIITVDNGDELQFPREGNNYYRLRVQPKADSGVVIMALLAMDRLRGAQS